MALTTYCHRANGWKGSNTTLTNNFKSSTRWGMGPLLLTWINFNPAWLSNYIHNKEYVKHLIKISRVSMNKMRFLPGTAGIWSDCYIWKASKFLEKRRYDHNTHVQSIHIFIDMKITAWIRFLCNWIESPLTNKWKKYKILPFWPVPCG